MFNWYNWLDSLLDMPMTLCASLSLSCALCVCRILIMPLQSLSAMFNVFWQTMRIGVKAAVMLP